MASFSYEFYQQLVVKSLQNWYMLGHKTGSTMTLPTSTKTCWVMNIFHKTLKITYTAPSLKKCIGAIPRLARAFE